MVLHGKNYWITQLNKIECAVALVMKKIIHMYKEKLSCFDSMDGFERDTCFEWLF